MKLSDPDEQFGVDIVKRALEEPIRQISNNAGLSPDVVVNDVLKAKEGRGLDARLGKIVNMIESGIIDPAKVTRNALQNAASIAEKARNKFSTLGGIEVEYTGDAQTLIDMPLTFEQVKFYESLGYKIFYHKDEAKCKDPNFLEPSRISAKIDYDERMKTRMLGFAKNNPDKIAEVTEKYDALNEESKAKLRGYLHFVGGTRTRKQTRRRRTTRRRKSLKK